MRVNEEKAAPVDALFEHYLWQPSTLGIGLLPHFASAKLQPRAKSVLEL